MSGIREQIASILTKHEDTRDDDNKLYALILLRRVQHTSHEFSQEEQEGITRFLDKMWKGKLPNFETIGRFRRKLQEENHDLRGKKYEARHRHSKNYTTQNMEGNWKI